MDPKRIAWIGAMVGTGIGIVGAAIGIALPFVMKPTDQPLSPDAGRNLAWGFGIGMTVFFAFMCALFGYLLWIRPACGPRERSFAVVSTIWGSLLVAAFPWFLYGLQDADDTIKIAGWMILGIYASIRLLGKWQETQLRIRSEEAVQSKAASTQGS